MRVAAMAAGAVGGYFGARMAAAGHDVFFIARGANLAAIKNNGLQIESVHGDLHLANVNATDDPNSVGPVDIVLFAVKLWDTETAAEQTQAPGRPQYPRHHLAERRRQRRARGADPRCRADRRRRRLYRQRDRRARPHQADQQFRADALRPRRQAPRRRAASFCRRRQGGQDRHRHLRRHRARALAEIHLPHRHGRLDRRLALADRGDPRRPRTARRFSGR